MRLKQLTIQLGTRVSGKYEKSISVRTSTLKVLLVLSAFDVDPLILGGNFGGVARCLDNGAMFLVAVGDALSVGKASFVGVV